MPVSGLVISFTRSVDQCRQAVDRIAKIEEVEIGQSNANRLAIVVTSENQTRDREIWSVIQTLPEVADIAVAFVGFDDERNVETSRDVCENDATSLPRPQDGS